MDRLELPNDFNFSVRMAALLTRREVLIQLKTLGVKEISLLKFYLRDFEKYMGTKYGIEITKTKRQKADLLDFRKDHFYPS